MRTVLICVMLLIALTASTGSASVAYVELLTHRYLTSGPDAGNWEYIYDVWGGTETWLKTVSLYFDVTQQVNVWYGTSHGTVTHAWCAMSVGYGLPFNGWTDPEHWPSNWADTNGDFIKDDWVLTPMPWGYYNSWHSGLAYGTYNTDQHCWQGLDAEANALHFRNTNGFRSGLWMTEGLSLTFRVVHPYAPGNITFGINGGTNDGTILGPAVGPADPGDFDEDGDVDADDIDLLCDNLGDAAYDLDGDNDADEDDMTYLVENLVELTDGIRVGTRRGDFNLDGLINATDLAIMNPNFGSSGIGYAAGNANCDDLVNATDLAILGANFGYVAPPAGAVPEPVSAMMLLIGCAAVLRPRTRRSA